MTTTRTLRRSDDLPLFAATLVVVAVSAGLMDFSDLSTFLAFGLLIAISELAQVTLPNEVPFSLGIAPGIGYALLGDHAVPETVVVFVAGTALAATVRALSRKPHGTAEIATHTLALAGAASVYDAVARAGLTPTFSKTNISPLGFVAMLVAVLAIEALVQTGRDALRERIPFVPVFVGRVRSTAALHLSVLSVGSLLALAYPPLGYWAFPLFLVPLAATRFAFRQYASIRTTYLQTIRALSKVPEMAGYTQPGHSTRVSELAVAIGRELGVGEQEVSEIQYAALLHDIGRVSIAEPEKADSANQLELAIVGAGIVRQTGHFPAVADMIEHQHDPYRRRGEDATRELPAGAKIIKVASTYDDYTNHGGPSLTPWDALERLHLGMAYDYDPQVIQALTRVLEKRGDI